MFNANFVPVPKREAVYDETSSLILEKAKTVLRFQELTKWFNELGFFSRDTNWNACAVHKDIVTLERVKLSFLKLAKIKEKFLITESNGETFTKLQKTFETVFSFLWQDLIQLNRKFSKTVGFTKDNIEIKKHLSNYNDCLDKFIFYVKNFMRLLSMSHS